MISKKEKNRNIRHRHDLNTRAGVTGVRNPGWGALLSVWTLGTLLWRGPRGGGKVCRTNKAIIT